MIAESHSGRRLALWRPGRPAGRAPEATKPKSMPTAISQPSRSPDPVTMATPLARYDRGQAQQGQRDRQDANCGQCMGMVPAPCYAHAWRLWRG